LLDAGCDMNEPFFTVEFTSIIEGRGLVIEGFTAEQYGMVKPGDALRLKRPDGSIIAATVKGVEYPPSVIYRGERPADARYHILVNCYDVPLGTEVFLDQEPSAK
jgi:hypothetical protein